MARKVHEAPSIGRREFFAQLSAVAAGSGLALGAASGEGAKTKSRMKIALFSGMFKAVPLRTAIESAAKIGYDGIEVMVGFGADHLDAGCTAKRAAQIKRMAADHHLNICLIYTTLGGDALASEQRRQKGLEIVERFLDIGDRVACKMLKVTAGRLRKSAYRDDEARIVAAWLGWACDRAAKHKSRIAAEIHLGQYCETVDMACKMIGLVDRPNFGVIHDAGNLHIAGGNYGADSVKRLGSRIFHVHIKDMVRAAADDAAAHDCPAGRFKRALLNRGDVDHRPLFAGLKKIGYGGYLSCEASGGDDPVAIAKHEFDEVQKILAAVSMDGSTKGRDNDQRSSASSEDSPSRLALAGRAAAGGGGGGRMSDRLEPGTFDAGADWQG